MFGHVVPWLPNAKRKQDQTTERNQKNWSAKREDSEKIGNCIQKIRKTFILFGGNWKVDLENDKYSACFLKAEKNGAGDI